MPPTPRWRRAFDRAERAVGAPLEQIVDTGPFASALVLVFRAQGAISGLVERQTRAVLHFWNLPAHTDVKRLNRQVALLANEVRRLAAQVEADEPVTAIVEEAPPPPSLPARRRQPAAPAARRRREPVARRS